MPMGGVRWGGPAGGQTDDLYGDDDVLAYIRQIKRQSAGCYWVGMGTQALVDDWLSSAAAPPKWSVPPLWWLSHRLPK
uniref:Uncharacterized protein n=1 Tax=Plectus sambesii TaxID=2011161 RepID=A0A914UYX4_9BILA